MLTRQGGQGAKHGMGVYLPEPRECVILARKWRQRERLTRGPEEVERRQRMWCEGRLVDVGAGRGLSLVLIIPSRSSVWVRVRGWVMREYATSELGRMLLGRHEAGRGVKVGGTSPYRRSRSTVLARARVARLSVAADSLARTPATRREAVLVGLVRLYRVCGAMAGSGALAMPLYIRRTRLSVHGNWHFERDGLSQLRDEIRDARATAKAVARCSWATRAKPASRARARRAMALNAAAQRVSASKDSRMSRGPAGIYGR